jgi:hypothetical protein
MAADRRNRRVDRVRHGARRKLAEDVSSATATYETKINQKN